MLAECIVCVSVCVVYFLVQFRGAVESGAVQPASAVEAIKAQYNIPQHEKDL